MESETSTMNLARRIEEIVTPTVEALGFRVVRVQVFGQGAARLQLMIERADGRPIEVDDCANVSRAISVLLDVEDPIAGAYTLEVSSPGIDRPLVRIGDFQRFAGREARLETLRPIDGRRRFRGRLKGVEGDLVRLAVEGADVVVPYGDIQRAKLVPADERMAAGKK
jgi:ribosome maturation factor RimP